MAIVKTVIVLPDSSDDKGQNKGKLAFVLSGVLDVDYCNHLIRMTEDKQYTPAVINTGSEHVIDTSIRNNSRYMTHDSDITNYIFDKIKEFIPVTFNGRKLVGIYDKMRYLKYRPGEYFKPHYDGITELDHGRVSMLTVQLYLNDNFTGGTTRFLSDNFDTIVDTTIDTTIDTTGEQFVDVIPQTGSVLIFEHEILHEGCILLSGTKYTVRMDILYK